MDDADAIRSELQRGLEKAGLLPSVVSRQLGRSKDYLGDFLRKTKNTIGHSEILTIRKMISDKINEPEKQSETSTYPVHDNSDIHIDLTAFREVLFATLRTLNVPPVLARSRIDDLLADLRSLSEARVPNSSTGRLRIDSESEAPEGDGRGARPNGK